MSNNKISNNKILNDKMSNTKKINLTNQSGFYESENKSDNIFDNVYLILFLFIIGISFIGYTVYTFIISTGNSVILNNSTYYGKDLLTFESLFQEIVNTIDDCITNCTNDVICDGITYDSNTKMCTGTKNGQIRSDNENLSAWVKPPSLKISTSDMAKDFTKAILVGYTTTNSVVDGSKLMNPYSIGKFSYSFNLTIYDFNKNYGNWRHVFHKGTAITKGTKLNYQSWENLVVEYPKQFIGVWLAPFTNNLRIAVTTNTLKNKHYGQYNDAFIQKCDNSTKQCYITDMPNSKWSSTSSLSDGSIPNQYVGTYIEYFDLDLQNIPLNTEINITVNFYGKNVDTLFNGKIRKTYALNGLAIFDKSSLYVMNDNTFGGEITNLIYYPDTLLLPEIKQIMALKAQKL
jgi:hypothetical protein